MPRKASVIFSGRRNSGYQDIADYYGRTLLANHNLIRLNEDDPLAFLNNNRYKDNVDILVIVVNASDREIPNEYRQNQVYVFNKLDQATPEQIKRLKFYIPFSFDSTEELTRYLESKIAALTDDLKCFVIDNFMNKALLVYIISGTLTSNTLVFTPSGKPLIIKYVTRMSEHTMTLYIQTEDRIHLGDNIGQRTESTGFTYKLGFFDWVRLIWNLTLSDYAQERSYLKTL